jgi:hypothetical protein
MKTETQMTTGKKQIQLASILRPAAQERIKKLMELGFHKPGDVEQRLGYYVGQLGR